MNRIIAAIATFALIGFAVALANSDTPTTDTRADQSTIMNQDTSSTTSATTSTPDTPGMSKSTTIHRSESVSSAKVCTDDNGATFHKGRPGYTKCLDSMKKSKKDQMGGTMGSDTPSTSSSNPRNPRDSGNSGNSSDTSDTSVVSPPPHMDGGNDHPVND